MHRIVEVAKLLGVSKQSIYRKLDCPELAGHIHDTDKGKYVDAEGIEILRGLLPFSVDSSGTTQEQSGNSSENTQEQFRNRQTDGQITNAYMTSLEEQLVYLKSIIANKDIQLSEKDKQINDLTQIAKNSQVLLRQEQEKNQLLLEASQAPQEAPKVSFFSRVFRK